MQYPRSAPLTLVCLSVGLSHVLFCDVGGSLTGIAGATESSSCRGPVTWMLLNWMQFVSQVSSFLLLSITAADNAVNDWTVST